MLDLLFNNDNYKQYRIFDFEKFKNQLDEKFNNNKFGNIKNNINKNFSGIKLSGIYDIYHKYIKYMYILYYLKYIIFYNDCIDNIIKINNKGCF